MVIEGLPWPAALSEANSLLKQQQAENIDLNLEQQKIIQKVTKERQQIEEWSMEKADIIKFNKQGRLKLLTLTPKGEEIAEHIDIIRNKL